MCSAARDRGDERAGSIAKGAGKLPLVVGDMVMMTTADDDDEE
jgi:hypothetical protein